MLEFIRNLFGTDFMPHGHCYFWRPEVVWLHVISDSLIAMAYYSIPIMLFHFVRKKKGMPFGWIFVMFAAFIFACGTTHLMAVWTLWTPVYRLDGLIKLVTAILSVATAGLLGPLLTRALALRTPKELEEANRALEREIAERQRMRVRVVQAEKLASLGLMSAGIAHEINNPLAYVANNLVMIRRDVTGLLTLVAILEEAQPQLRSIRPDLADRAARLTDQIDLAYVKDNLDPILESTRQGVKRVADIIQSLRRFARLDHAKDDWVDVHEAITCSLEMLRGRLERCRIAVEQHFADLPRIPGEQAQVNQVIMNIVVNSIQAVESCSREGGRIEISTRRAGDEVIVEVADNGAGIPPDVLPRIFDPFFTTKAIGDGTGLGMSISHGIVSDHGGRIEVESTPGQGSRFRVVLPAGGNT